MSAENGFATKQSINLYTAELRPKKEPLQAGAAASVLVVVVLLMAALFGYTQWQSLKAEHSHARITARVDALNEQVTTLTRTIESRQERPQQRDVLTRLTSEVGQRRRILADVEVLATPDNRGFSDYLQALARQTLDGVWLTGVHLADSGSYVALEGEARAGERVPAYLERLSEEPVFSGSSFESFALDRPEDRNVIRFHIATAVKAAEANDEF